MIKEGLRLKQLEKVNLRNDAVKNIKNQSHRGRRLSPHVTLKNNIK